MPAPSRRSAFDSTGCRSPWNLLRPGPVRCNHPNCLPDPLDQAGAPRRADRPARATPSLDAVLDWSYRLLDPAAQLVFRRLAVFTGSFDRQCAIHVIGRDLEPDPGRDGLAHLTWTSASSHRSADRRFDCAFSRRSELRRGAARRIRRASRDREIACRVVHRVGRARSRSFRERAADEVARHVGRRVHQYPRCVGLVTRP